MPLPMTVPGTDVAEPGQLTDVGVEGEVGGAGVGERVAEVARAAADVEHGRARRGRRTAPTCAAESCARAV